VRLGASAEAKPDAKPPAELDPFRPELYRTNQSFEAALGVETVLASLPVRSPERSWWIRRHPSPEYSLGVWVIDLREERE
jgi:hypothetical protein